MNKQEGFPILTTPEQKEARGNYLVSLKREKIKEEIKTILKERYGENWIHGKVALQIIYAFQSQGMALRVDRELPDDPHLNRLMENMDKMQGEMEHESNTDKWAELDRKVHLIAIILTEVSIRERKLVKAGYTAWAPLVEKETN